MLSYGFAIFMTSDATRMSRSGLAHLLRAAPIRIYKLVMPVLVGAATDLIPAGKVERGERKRTADEVSKAD